MVDLVFIKWPSILLLALKEILMFWLWTEIYLRSFCFILNDIRPRNGKEKYLYEVET